MDERREGGREEVKGRQGRGERYGQKGGEGREGGRDGSLPRSCNNDTLVARNKPLTARRRDKQQQAFGRAGLGAVRGWVCVRDPSLFRFLRSVIILSPFFLPHYPFSFPLSLPH